MAAQPPRMGSLRWTAFGWLAWAALGCVLELPLAAAAGAQAEASPCAEGTSGQAPPGCVPPPPPPPPVLSPLDVLLCGAGTFGSLILLRRPTAPS
jgi:hypothetical protein